MCATHALTLRSAHGTACVAAHIRQSLYTRTDARTHGLYFYCSLDRMGMAYVDLYSLHFPFPYIGGQSALAEGLARARERGLCRHVGVCNMDAKQVRVLRACI